MTTAAVSQTPYHAPHPSELPLAARVALGILIALGTVIASIAWGHHLGTFVRPEPISVILLGGVLATAIPLLCAPTKDPAPPAEVSEQEEESRTETLEELFAKASRTTFANEEISLQTLDHAIKYEEDPRASLSRLLTLTLPYSTSWCVVLLSKVEAEIRFGNLDEAKTSLKQFLPRDDESCAYFHRFTLHEDFLIDRFVDHFLIFGQASHLSFELKNEEWGRQFLASACAHLYRVQEADERERVRQVVDKILPSSDETLEERLAAFLWQSEEYKDLAYRLAPTPTRLFELCKDNPRKYIRRMLTLVKGDQNLQEEALEAIWDEKPRGDDLLMQIDKCYLADYAEKKKSIEHEEILLRFVTDCQKKGFFAEVLGEEHQDLGQAKIVCLTRLPRLREMPSDRRTRRQRMSFRHQELALQLAETLPWTPPLAQALCDFLEEKQTKKEKNTLLSLLYGHLALKRLQIAQIIHEARMKRLTEDRQKPRGKGGRKLNEPAYKRACEANEKKAREELEEIKNGPLRRARELGKGNKKCTKLVEKFLKNKFHEQLFSDS